MPRYSGDVTLPDGRQFHVVAVFSERERDTNGSDLLSADLYDLDGNEVDPDIQNEEIGWPGSYDGKTYLWSACVDLVCQQPPDEVDFGY